MKNKKVILLGITVLIIIIIMGLILYKNTFNLNASDKIKPSRIDDLSSLILTSEDFPQNQGWTLKDRVERARSDVSERGLALGWKRGYYASYIRGDLKLENLDYSRFDVFISEYPPENITMAFLNVTESNDIIYDSLSVPRIGDESRVYKETHAGDTNTYYTLEFRKGTIYVRTFMYGIRTDFQLLKDLTEKIE